MTRLINNTVSRVATRMLRGVSLVTEAESEYKLASENWAYPVKAWGESFDQYYAEVWQSGMDWNAIYWILERVNFHDPVCWPLLFFEKHKDRDLIYEFDLLLEAIFWLRREDEWTGRSGLGIYGDNVWSYIKAVQFSTHPSPPMGMTRVRMKHASQEPVMFWISDHVLPQESRIQS